MLQAFRKLYPKPETIPEPKKCTAADLGWLAADNDRQSYQRFSQTSERMRFGPWWTFWAYDVKFAQKYFNCTVCCFINVKLCFNLLTGYLLVNLLSVSKTPENMLWNWKIRGWDGWLTILIASYSRLKPWLRTIDGLRWLMAASHGLRVQRRKWTAAN